MENEGAPATPPGDHDMGSRAPMDTPAPPVLEDVDDVISDQVDLSLELEASELSVAEGEAEMDTPVLIDQIPHLNKQVHQSSGNQSVIDKDEMNQASGQPEEVNQNGDHSTRPRQKLDEGEHLVPGELSDGSDDDDVEELAELREQDVEQFSGELFKVILNEVTEELIRQDVMDIHKEESLKSELHQTVFTYIVTACHRVLGDKNAYHIEGNVNIKSLQEDGREYQLSFENILDEDTLGKQPIKIEPLIRDIESSPEPILRSYPSPEEDDQDDTYLPVRKLVRSRRKRKRPTKVRIRENISDLEEEIEEPQVKKKRRGRKKMTEEEKEEARLKREARKRVEIDNLLDMADDEPKDRKLRVRKTRVPANSKEDMPIPPEAMKPNMKRRKDGKIDRRSLSFNPNRAPKVNPHPYPWETDFSEFDNDIKKNEGIHATLFATRDYINGAKDRQKGKREIRSFLWKRNQRKLRCQLGEEYINSAGKYIPARVRPSGPPCGEKCRLGCYMRLPAEECDEINKRFKLLVTKERQDQYLYHLLVRKEVKRRKTSCEPSAFRARHHAVHYYIRRLDGSCLNVCQAAFLNVYTIGDGRATRLFKIQAERGPNNVPDFIDRRKGRPKNNEEIDTMIREHIEKCMKEDEEEIKNYRVPKRSMTGMWEGLMSIHEPETLEKYKMGLKVLPRISWSRFRNIYKDEYEIIYPMRQSKTKPNVKERKKISYTSEQRVKQIKPAKYEQDKQDIAEVHVRNEVVPESVDKIQGTIFHQEFRKVMSGPYIAGTVPPMSSTNCLQGAQNPHDQISSQMAPHYGLPPQTYPHAGITPQSARPLEIAPVLSGHNTDLPAQASLENSLTSLGNQRAAHQFPEYMRHTAGHAAHITSNVPSTHQSSKTPQVSHLESQLAPPFHAYGMPQNMNSAHTDAQNNFSLGNVPPLIFPSPVAHRQYLNTSQDIINLSRHHQM